MANNMTKIGANKLIFEDRLSKTNFMEVYGYGNAEQDKQGRGA